MATAAETERRSPVQALSAEFVDTFGNVLFAVSLLVVWGIMTLIGVLVDQGKDTSTYFNEYPPQLARAILRLGLDHIYHSYEYVGVIGLILTSISVCTFKRVIPARLPPLRPVVVDKIPLHAFIEARGSEEEVKSRLERFLVKSGWQIRRKVFNGLAQVIVQSARGALDAAGISAVQQEGEITLTASSANLISARATITAAKKA